MKRQGNYSRGTDNNMYKHGMSDTPTWNSWRAMKYRATISNRDRDIEYRKLGMVKRWEKFENFLNDMGERPDGMTIERINNKKGYRKSNCKWATKSEQNINKKHSYKPNKWGYRGVKIYKKGSGGKHFAARLGSNIHLGYFHTPEEAALAYNKKAIELYGDKAILNEV